MPAPMIRVTALIAAIGFTLNCQIARADTPSSGVHNISASVSDQTVRVEVEKRWQDHDRAEVLLSDEGSPNDHTDDDRPIFLHASIMTTTIPG